MQNVSNKINDYWFNRRVDEKCEIHGCSLYKVDFPEEQLICWKCLSETVETLKKNEGVEFSKIVKKRKSKDVLKRDSILTDDDLKAANFNNFKPNNDETTEALNKARNIAGEYLVKDNKFNTLITGAPGRGKSHLAMSILKAVNDYSDEPQSCLFISTDELFRRIKESFNYADNKYSEGNMTRLLTKVDLLVLDDLGSESSMNRDKAASDFVQRTLFGILNARKRTIITTNLNAIELSNMYNDKLVSRMEKGIQGHIIKFTDKTEDHRK